MSALEVCVFDAVNARAGEPVMRLRLVSERVTGRELIERRVRQEVARQNERPGEYLRTLVRPTDAEETLNGWRPRKPVIIDAERQVARALDAFADHGFFLLVDDLQIEALEQEFTVMPDTRVTFIRLVPLVGG